MDENQTENTAGFPMRINKYLAMEGRGSRREMDKMIALGKVLVNGTVALLGSKVNEGDKVEVRFHGTKEKQKGHQMAHIRHAKRLRKK